MSDEEREYSEEEEEEEEEEDDKRRGRDSESQHRQKTPHIEESQQKSEAELLMEEKLKKRGAEEEDQWREYIENWRKQRNKEEEELRKLKEKQQKRKAKREAEDRKLYEQKRQQEEQRARETEEKRAKEMEEKKRRLEEAEKRRQAMLKQVTGPSASDVKPNFVIQKRSDGGPGASLGGSAMDKMMNVAAARGDMGKTKEQLADDKKIALSFRVQPLEIEGLPVDQLKLKAKELWEAILKLETEKYDLEERQKRQEYDLKELNERQRQINRNRALKKGLDPESLTGRFPPKLQVASKYERRIDRRTFGDKKGLFDGGYEAQYTQVQEKSWDDRMNSFDEKKGKLPKWLGEQPGKKPGDPDEEEEKHEEIRTEDVAEEEEEEAEEEEEDEEED
jgi:troponin T